MNEKYMKIAIEEAKKAYNELEIPVGAVLVCNNEIVATSHNTIEKENNVINHAEVNVINQAIKQKDNWRLNNCDLYVTLEPCMMCRGLITECRIKNVYYLLNSSTKKELVKLQKINIDIEEKDYKNLIKTFFNKIR